MSHENLSNNLDQKRTSNQKKDKFSRRDALRLLALITVFPVVHAGSRFVQDLTSPTPSAPSKEDVNTNETTPKCVGAKDALNKVNEAKNSPNLGYKWTEIEALQGLSNPLLCDEDKIALQREVAVAQLEQIFEQKHPPVDSYFQELTVTRYNEWKERVKKMNLPENTLPGHWVIARRAYETDNFLLAKLVLDEASLNGELQNLSLTNVFFVYATLRNLGFWYTRYKGGSDYNQGLQYLAAANELTTGYRVGGEAHKDLEDLLGSDETKWPVPGDEPLLRPGVLPDFKAAK